MPQLNLRPAVTSLLLQDRITVSRRAERVDGYGENGMSNQIFPNIAAVVWPEGENKLDRRPEAQSATKVIGIVTTFALQLATPGFQADEVRWKGNRYLVTSLGDYSQFGAGFTYAMAEALPVEQEANQNKEVYT